MNNFTKQLVLIATLLLLNTQLHAHNMWIETSQNGEIGKFHSAKIYLWGYGENERDSTTKWFSNTKDFVITLTSPSGKKSILTQNVF